MDEEVFIDANIFLEIFLDDSKAEDCKEILRSMRENKKQAVTTDFLIYSCILILYSDLKETKFIRNAIIFLNFYNNLRIVRPSFDDMYDAAEVMEKNKLDFDDSLVVSCMKNNGINKIVSLDKHFDKVNGVERIKP